MHADRRHPLAVPGLGHDADLSPVPPVDDVHRYAGAAQARGERVLDGAGGGVVGLSRVSAERLSRGEESEEIKPLAAQRPPKYDGAARLRCQCRLECALLHALEPHVAQHDRRVERAVDWPETLPDRGHRGRHAGIVAGVHREVRCAAAGGRDPLELALDVGGHWPPAQQGDVRGGAAAQMHRQFRPDSAGAAEDQVRAAAAERRLCGGRRLFRLAQRKGPPAPVAQHHLVPVRVAGLGGHRGGGRVRAVSGEVRGGDVEAADPPCRLLLGQRTGQAEDGGGERAAGSLVVEAMRVAGHRDKLDGSVTVGQQGLHHAEQRQHARLLGTVLRLKRINTVADRGVEPVIESAQEVDARGGGHATQPVGQFVRCLAGGQPYDVHAACAVLGREALGQPQVLWGRDHEDAVVLGHGRLGRRVELPPPRDVEASAYRWLELTVGQSPDCDAWPAFGIQDGHVALAPLDLAHVRQAAFRYGLQEADLVHRERHGRPFLLLVIGLDGRDRLDGAVEHARGKLSAGGAADQRGEGFFVVMPDFLNAGEMRTVEHAGACEPLVVVLRVCPLGTA